MKNTATIICLLSACLLGLAAAQVETILNGTVSFSVDGEPNEFVSNITVMGEGLTEEVEAAMANSEEAGAADAAAVSGFLDALEGKTFYDATWLTESYRNAVFFSIGASNPESYSNIIEISFSLDQESLELLPEDSKLSYRPVDGGMFDFYVLEAADISLTTLEPSGDGTIRVAGTFSGELPAFDMGDLEGSVVVEGTFEIEKVNNGDEMIGTFFEMLDMD